MSNRWYVRYIEKSAKEVAKKRRLEAKTSADEAAPKKRRLRAAVADDVQKKSSDGECS